MSNKQTALNFLLTELDIPKLISREKLIMAGEVVRQAKEMEKEQIIHAYNQSRHFRDKPYKTAEKYYNETFE